MDIIRTIVADYSHPEPKSEREAEIIARVDFLDHKKRVAVLTKNAEALATIQAELDALMVEWDAGRGVVAAE